MIKNKLFHKKGFSLLGSLIGFSFLGVSTVGLATYMGNFEKIQVQYSEESGILFQHKSLIESAKSMLIGVQINEAKADQQGDLSVVAEAHKTHGICKLVQSALSYQNANAQTFCPIEIPSNNIIGANYMSDRRWGYFLKVISNNSWKLAPGKCGTGVNGFVGAFTENNLKKCVKTVAVNEKSFFARVKVIPKDIVSNKDIVSGTIPIDRLAYRIETVISVPAQADEGVEISYSVSKSEKLVLSSEILECHVCKTSTCAQNIVARLSTSSIGLSSSISNICYHADRSEGGICSALSSDYVKKNIVQAGRQTVVSGDGSDGGTNVIVQSNTLQNVALSCSTHVFRCANDTANRFKIEEEFDPSLRMTYGLYLDTISKPSNIDSIDFKIGTQSLPALHDAGDGRARVGRDGSGLKTFNKKDNFWPLKSGGTEVTTYASIKYGNTNICESICTAPGTKRPSLRVKYNKEFSGGSKACTPTADISFDSGVKAECTVCYMKNCHRYGVGTFGKSQDQPKEPFDGSVPECVLNKSYALDTSVNNVTDASELGNKCVVKTSSGVKAVVCGNDGVRHTKASYKYASGDKKTLCFVNGKSEIIPGASEGLSASLNCLAPLKEVQKLGAENSEGTWRNGLLPSLALAYNLPPASSNATLRTVKKVLTDGGLSVKTKDSKEVFEIENSANMATYFSDPFDSSVTVSSSDEVWVNIQRDASGAFHGGWPFMMKGGDWSFFYREPFEGVRFKGVSATRKDVLSRARPARPIFVKMDDFGIDGPTTGAGHYTNETATDTAVKGLQLVHHLKYKGLRGVKKTTTREFPYLCRSLTTTSSMKDMFKLSSIRGKSLDFGQTACQNLGPQWYFIPPDSRELWAAALQAVEPNAVRYSFPNPFKFADGVPFHNSQSQVTFEFSQFPVADLTLSKNSDHHMIVDKGLMKVPSAAWVGLVSAQGVTSPKPSRVWDWSPHWSKVFGSDLKTTSLFQNSNPIGQFTDMNKTGDADIGTALGQGGWKHSGVIDKAGNMLTIVELRELMGSDGDIHQKFTKICISKDSNKDLWTHRMPLIRGASIGSGGWVKTCTASHKTGDEMLTGLADLEVTNSSRLSKLEKLTSVKGASMFQGIRPAYTLAKFYKAGAYHVQNEVRFCHVWKAEKQRRAVGQCAVKAYNSSTNSKALLKGSVPHSKKITESSRENKNICHKNTNGCGGAYAFYTSEKNKAAAGSALRTSLETLVNRGSTSIKNECFSAISNKKFNAQVFTPTGLPSYSYNFNDAADSRCWSADKLLTSIPKKYTVGSTDVNDHLNITVNGHKQNYLWSQSVMPSDTSQLGELKEDVFVDLPDISDDDLCDDDDIDYDSFINDRSNCSIN